MTGQLFSVIILSICVTALNAQDITDTTGQSISLKYIDNIYSKSASLQDKLKKKSFKTVQSLKKQEERIKKKLQKADSVLAQNIFGDLGLVYENLERRLQDSTLNRYVPDIDSLSASLKFLQENPQMLKEAKPVKEKLVDALKKTEGFARQLRKAEE